MLKESEKNRVSEGQITMRGFIILGFLIGLIAVFLLVLKNVLLL